MRLKIIGLILFGFLLSLAGGFGTFHYTRTIEAERDSLRLSLEAFGTTVALQVPNRDIPYGSQIAPSDFTTIRLPASYLPTNLLRDLPPRGEGQDLLAMGDLQKGRLLLQGDLALADATTEATLIPAPDSNIFAFTPRNLAEFGDAVTVGSRIDLVWTRDLGAGQFETRLLGVGLRVHSLPDPSRANDGGLAPLADKMLVEGPTMTALRSLAAEQMGAFHILISDGGRDLRLHEARVGPNDLAALPLIVRETALTPAREGGGSIFAQITGEDAKRKTCVTAVIRGGARSSTEVPC